MSRGLGCIEYKNGLRRYFVHCHTSECSIPPTFPTAAAAEKAYEKLGVEGLSDMDGLSKKISVVRIAIANCWPAHSFVGWDFKEFGLATQDTLIEPRSYDAERKVLYLFEGRVHIANAVNGGMFNAPDSPLCHLNLREKPEAQQLSYDQVFDNQTPFCPSCVAALIK